MSRDSGVPSTPRKFGKGPRTPQVGYVVKMFPRLSETFILNEVLELEAQGLALHVYSLKRPNDSVIHEDVCRIRAAVTYLPERIRRELPRTLSAQVRVFKRYPLSYLTTLAWVLKRRRRNSLKKFFQACCLIREMQEIGHLHAAFASGPAQVAVLAHMIAGIPYSLTAHAKDLYAEGHFSSPGLRHRIKMARFVVTISEHNAKRLKTFLERNVPPKVYTVYNGLDLDKFKPRQGCPAEPTILSVGRLVEKKGFRDLIHACRLLGERGLKFSCEIVGMGPLRGDLLELIRRYRLEGRVRLLGPLAHSELIRNHYAKAMVFALPCVVAGDGDRDMLPNVLKEAMAVGVPIVTTTLDGIDELIEHGSTGLLVPPRDPLALADALEWLILDRALRDRLASQARKVIEASFDKRTNVPQMKNLLLDALRERSLETLQAEAVESKELMI